jgi:ABC-type glycerol-3-phosphate transport system substrate-binding protein
MGGAPTRRDILEDPELSRKFAAYYGTLKKVLPTAVPAIPMMLEQIRFEDIVNDYLGAALLGEMSAEDALNRAAKELSRLR